MTNNTDWDSLLSDNVDINWNNWQKVYGDHNCIPRVSVKSKESFPWINKPILQTIAKRNACYSLLIEEYPECYSTLYKYKVLRNKVVGFSERKKENIILKI